MRIISGKARGTRLATIEGLNTRPTTDRVKESMFNLIQFDIPGARVIDLFAGSGALGLEAASRGAESVVLVENFRKCHDAIEHNIDKSGLANISLMKAEVLSAIPRLGQADVILMDPPYSQDFVVPVLTKLQENDVLSKEGIIVVEHSRNDKLPSQVGQLKKVKEKKYGIAMVTIFSYE